MEAVVPNAVQENFIHLRGWVTSVGAIQHSREKNLAYQDGRSHAVKCPEEPGRIVQIHFVCLPLLQSGVCVVKKTSCF